MSYIQKNENCPIRIAHVIGPMLNGGVESVVFNYYKHIDKTQFQFDFFYDEISTREPPQELLDMGARFYKVPAYKNIFAFIKTLTSLFEKNQYQIVHSHMNTLNVFPLYVAKKAGVPVRIAHNHSTAGKGELKKKAFKYILRPFAKVFPTHLAACSQYAGEWIYGKRAKFTVWNNAIELEKFAFNQEIRDSVRNELQLENNFVIGHVGRFCAQKNQPFLIDVFAEVCKQKENAMLMLVGEGNLLQATKEKVMALGLQDKVLFLGNKTNVAELYQAMDVFVLPSRYEGLPVVGVEAQTSGLSCVLSDAMTNETKVLDCTVFLSLKDSTVDWANAIVKAESTQRSCTSKIIEERGFDIRKEANTLAGEYCQLLSGISAWS